MHQVSSVQRSGCHLFWSGRVLVVVLAITHLSVADAGTMFFDESFDTATVTANLSLPAGWTSGTNSSPAGVAQNNASPVYDPVSETNITPRTYITTVATNYNTVDFIYEVSFTVAGGGGQGLAYVGIGSGQPNSGFYDEPASAFYLRQSPTDFDRGSTGYSIGLPNGTHVESPLANPGPGNGAYRAQVQKVGNLVTIGLDTNYTGGPFVATYSATKSMLTELSFLDSTNTRLFFGTASASTTFDNLSITGPGAVPEIDPAGTGSVLALVTGALGVIERRRRERKVC